MARGGKVMILTKDPAIESQPMQVLGTTAVRTTGFQVLFRPCGNAFMRYSGARLILLA
jgi:hypothetical protein